MKRNLSQLSNNLTHLSNKPGIIGYKRQLLDTVQGGGMLARQHFIGEASTVSDAPVLGGEFGTFQQILVGPRDDDLFHVEWGAWSI